MADTISTEKRRAVMQRIRKTDTGPERVVRRLLHAMGYRYRLYQRDLPGNPDIVFRGRRQAIFVHGCFWHHHDCPLGRLPKSRQDYWVPKLLGNRARDHRNRLALRKLSWRCLVIWECEITDAQALSKRLRTFLGATRSGQRMESRRVKQR